MRIRSLLLLTAGLSGPLAAEPPPPSDAHEARFRAADTDASRSLNRAEVAAGMPKVILQHFEAIDLNADGEITPEELREMAAREAAAREARREARLRRLQGR